ncbi:MAG: hypothetical protein RLZZ505_2706 [Verrucomicrobiota bacterium]
MRNSLLSCCLVFLEALAAEPNTVLFSYQSSNGTETVSLPNRGMSRVAGSLWSRETQTQAVPGRTDCENITLTVKLLEGESKAANISYVMDFSDWDPAGYVMVPGAVYNGNRFDVLPQGYPPLWRSACRTRQGESAFALVESFAELHQATAARDAVRQ